MSKLQYADFSDDLKARYRTNPVRPFICAACPPQDPPRKPSRDASTLKIHLMRVHGAPYDLLYGDTRVHTEAEIAAIREGRQQRRRALASRQLARRLCDVP